MPEWERPAAMAPPPGSSGSTGGESNWRKAGHNEDDAMECFYGLVRDATRTCYGIYVRAGDRTPVRSIRSPLHIDLASSINFVKNNCSVI
jgi:hypothetical protein